VARDVAAILIETGRTVHPGPWVERLVREVVAARAAMLPANMI
jgi:hypothetical protein